MGHKWENQLNNDKIIIKAISGNILAGSFGAVSP